MAIKNKNKIGVVSMKKRISLLLAVLLCLIATVTFLSCDDKHEHTYGTEWSKDATHHWHECEGEDCTRSADKAEHEWAKQEFYAENGDLVFDCTVCGARKKEPVPLTENEWKSAFRATTTAENITWTYQTNNNAVKTNRIDGNKAYVTNSHPYNETKDCYYLVEKDGKIWHYTAVQENVWSRKQVYSMEDSSYPKAMMNEFMNQYSAFMLNKETRAYEIEQVQMNGLSLVNIAIRIENGYVTYFTYTIKQLSTTNGDYKVVVAFSDYGTTSVTIPSISQ